MQLRCLAEVLLSNYFYRNLQGIFLLEGQQFFAYANYKNRQYSRLLIDRPFFNLESEEYLLFIIEMFARIAKALHKIVPVTIALTSSIMNPSIQLSQSNKPEQQHDSARNLFGKFPCKIRFIKNFEDYVQNHLLPGKVVIIFQFTGNPSIDDQVVAIAKSFVQNRDSEISTDYQFIFLQAGNSQPEEDEDLYFIVYTHSGERIVNVSNHLNKSKDSNQIKINPNLLEKRLLESLNMYRQIGIDNISKQLSQVDIESDYVAMITTSQQDYSTLQAKRILKECQRQYETKSKGLRKFVIKDQQTRRIFGIRDNQQKQSPFIIVPHNKNLKKQFREKAQFFSINGKKFTKINLKTSPSFNDIFVFPPVQKQVPSSEFVLNVQINKNQTEDEAEQIIYEQLSKPEYSQYNKAIYYSNDVEGAAIFYEMNDYSRKSLQAFEIDTKMPKEQRKHILTHTFQYKLPLKNSNDFQNGKVLAWINLCKQGKIQEYFPSEKTAEIWSQTITGEEYKQVRDKPVDKIIYHYSQHCHGCKKFGGNYENFAKNKSKNHPHINFYRINNDLNKSEGVRNYNSTPIFAFYKKGYGNPFLYRMPIFTDALFNDFLNITSEVKVFSFADLNSHIKSHSISEPLIKQLMDELKI